MLSCQNLHFQYSLQKSFVFPDVSCADAETLLILGKSGQGKTTLLHLLAMLLEPQSGSIKINDQEITTLSKSKITQFRAENIGIVYQRSHFVASLSVLENLILANYLADKTTNTEKAKTLANSLGFAEQLHKKTNQLSQGEQQRVSIARALMNTPNLILADEPTSNLDDDNCQSVVKLLQEQSAEIGASLVIVTHDQRLKDIFPKQIQI